MDNNQDKMITGEIKGIMYIPTGLVNERVQLEPTDRQKRGDTFFLYFVLITANALMFVRGACIVWTSPVIPQLKSNNSEINPLKDPITTIQVSMLFGIPSMCMILSTLLFGKLPDIIGRKYTLLCTSLTILLASLLMFLFPNHVYIYIIGRSFVVLGYGLVPSVLPIYLNEICEDHNRAKHGCLMMFFMPLGSVYSYIVGPTTTVRWFTLLCAAPLIPQIAFLLVLVPDSPIYSAAKKDRATTIGILKKLRSNKCEEEIEEDYMKIETTLETRNEAFGGGFKKLFGTRSLRRGVLIGLVVYLSIPLSGATLVMAYLAPIFNDTDTNLSGNTVALLAGIVKLVFFFVTFVIVGKFGRRPLLLFSSITTALTLAVTSVYFYLNEVNSTGVDQLKWLPVLCVLVYIACFSSGIGSIPTPLLSELFPDDMRSTACSFVRTFITIISTLCALSFPLLVDYVGVYSCFGIFTVCCFLIFIFMYFLLPETRGKSFSEIQELLNG
ncbi:facilitated trehalose transporter Tret1-like [Leptinotarsa decemlineata]|uniref:facilitated trehalose transporter Tret1-like n=1 Tax=Leptinotarsa decemlineata TaxID=7539 RepID=UPI003D306F27